MAEIEYYGLGDFQIKLNPTELYCLKKHAKSLSMDVAEVSRMHIEALLVCLGQQGFVSLDNIDNAM